MFLFKNRINKCLTFLPANELALVPYKQKPKDKATYKNIFSSSKSRFDKNTAGFLLKTRDLQQNETKPCVSTKQNIKSTDFLFYHRI